MRKSKTAKAYREEIIEILKAFNDIRLHAIVYGLLVAILNDAEGCEKNIESMYTVFGREL